MLSENFQEMPPLPKHSLPKGLYDLANQKLTPIQNLYQMKRYREYFQSLKSGEKGEDFLDTKQEELFDKRVTLKSFDIGRPPNKKLSINNSQRRESEDDTILKELLDFSLLKTLSKVNEFLLTGQPLGQSEALECQKLFPQIQQNFQKFFASKGFNEPSDGLGGISLDNKMLVLSNKQSELVKMLADSKQDQRDYKETIKFLKEQVAQLQ